MQPGLEQPQVSMMVRRRIQFQRPLDHGRRPRPLPEREQGFGGIPGEHGADGAFQSKLTRNVDTTHGLACCIVVPADMVERVRVVDVEAQQRPGVAASEVADPLECGEALRPLGRRQPGWCQA